MKTSTKQIHQNRFDQLLRKLEAATRDLGDLANSLLATPSPDPPDIRMGNLRDVVRMAKELGEQITYECARTWLMTGKLRRLYTSVGGHFILDLDHAKTFLEERKRRRETDVQVREAEAAAAWPARQSVEQLANAMNLHPTWVQDAINFRVLIPAGTAPNGVPYFEFSYRKMKELRDSKRMDLVAAVGQASVAAKEEASQKRHAEGEAAFAADRYRKGKIEKEHERQDRIAGRK